MSVCGIDPGLHVTGYSVVAGTAHLPRIVEAGVIRTDRQAPLAQRLAQLERDIVAILEGRSLRLVAIERLYSHYKHPRTAILMGHARGVIMLVAARLGLEVREYSATQIKNALTGNGRAGKRQVQRSVAHVFGLAELPEPPDVADALAVALCSMYDCSGIIGGTGRTGANDDEPVGGQSAATESPLKTTAADGLPAAKETRR